MTKHLHLVHAFTIAFCLLLIAANRSRASDDQSVLRRWAIVATNEVQTTGLSDLFAAEFSELQGIELVERDQIDLATGELELSACVHATASAERLKLGRILKADALVLLSKVAFNEKDFLRVIVSDCHYGARLRVEHFSYEVDDPAALSLRCEAVVRETRQHYANGIRHLIAVTPFLSKNFTHDYDHLQAGYRALVENALSVHPGVAVLEIDEARAIRQELALGGGALKRRVMPLFVEGQYGVSTASRDEPKVKLSIRVRDGRSVVGEAERAELSEDDAIRLLTEIVPRNLIKLSQRDGNVSLSRQRQHDLLVARAESFSRVGQWEQSTALREAALLLRPNNTEQRLAVFSDYHHWHFARHRVHAEQEGQLFQSRGKGISPDDLKAKWDRIYDERLSRFRLMALHTSKLIHDRAVNAYEADLLTSFAHRDPRILGLSGEAGRPEFREALYGFFWDVYPQFPKLDPTVHDGKARSVVLASDPWSPTSPEQARLRHSLDVQLQKWTQSAIIFLTQTAPYEIRAWEGPRSANRSYGWQDQRTLDDLYRFLTEVVPPDKPLWSMAHLTLGRSTFHRNSLFDMMQAGRLSPDDVRHFCMRLKESNSPLNVFYARCGLFTLQFRASDAETDGSALAEADALSEWIRQEQDRRDDSNFCSQFVYQLRGLREDLVARVNAATKKRHQLLPNVIPPHVPEPRITFIPVRGVKPNWDHVIACGDSLDVMWSRQAVYAMSQPGEAKQIFMAPEKDRVVRVVWDGRYIWVGSLKSGILVFTPNGKLLATVGKEQGLPPYEDGLQKSGFIRFPFRHPLMLHPVAPGRCLALGRFGRHGRVWISVIKEQDDGSGKATFRAEVIHTATKTDEASPNEIDKIFNLTWWAEYPDPSLKEHRQLLLGKWPPTLRPLTVDLQDFEISIFDSQFNQALRMLAVGHNLVSDFPFRVSLYRPPDESSHGRWRSKTLIPTNKERPGIEDTLVPALLRYQGALYNPGPYWRRIDESDFHVEQLNTVPLPHRHRYEHYGVSAHYGMVAWTGKEVYHRVLINEPVPDVADSATTYPEVPEDERQRHDQAVQSLRRLGASVDAMWGVPCWEPANPEWDIQTSHHSPRAFTVVYLSNEWRGGDGGLDHLKDLHNLQVVSLVQADVSDAGLEWLGALEGLRLLHLVETSATDAGLAHLQSLKQLEYLRLEGSISGKEFTDAGLESLAGLRLRRLALYGHGFTAKAAIHLGKIEGLQTLLLYDTDIPEDALTDLKKGNPSLKWQRRPCKNRCHHPECQTSK